MKLLNCETNEEKTVVGLKSNDKFQYLIVLAQRWCAPWMSCVHCAALAIRTELRLPDILLFWLLCVVSFDCARAQLSVAVSNIALCVHRVRSADTSRDSAWSWHLWHCMVRMGGSTRWPSLAISPLQFTSVPRDENTPNHFIHAIDIDLALASSSSARWCTSSLLLIDCVITITTKNGIVLFEIDYIVFSISLLCGLHAC